MLAPFTILGFSIDGWVLLGLFGQFFFFLRLVGQWIYSERVGKSIVPPFYWYLSVAGTIPVFLYVIHIWDPVFFFGQIIAFTIYVRNIILNHKGQRMVDIISEEK